MSQMNTEKSFVDLELENVTNVNPVLEKINKLVKWDRINKKLISKYKKSASADGRPAYPAIVMFKVLLLQRMYNLSDPQMEACLKDRISFFQFVGLSIKHSKPDHSTICRFRQALVKLNLCEELFNEINSQLEEAGLLIKNGAIVDATLVSSARRPRKTIDIEDMPEDRKEEEELECESETKTDGSEAEEPGQEETGEKRFKIRYSDDANSSWIKKGKEAVYGQKAHIVVDSEDGYILGGHMTPAHVSDTTQLEKVLEKVELKKETAVFADKGYCSESNREKVKTRGLLDFIMHKARRNHPLSEGLKNLNKAISKIRYKVERTIGTLKRLYGFNRLRYVGDKKSDMEFYLSAMVYNLRKAGLKLEAVKS